MICQNLYNKAPTNIRYVVDPGTAYLVGMGLTSGLGLAGNILSGAQMSQNVKSTNKTNLLLAEKQNQWNIDMWNRTNEYNTPSNQLNLLMDAGLNPLMFGEHLSNVSPSSTIQSANLANQIPDTASPALYAQAANQFMQSQVQAMDYYLKSRQLDQEDRRLDQQDTLIGQSGRRLESDLSTAEHTRKQIDQNIEYLKQQGKVSEAQAKNLTQQTANLVTSQKELEGRIALLGEQLNGQIIANHRSNIAWQIEQATMDPKIQQAFLECGLSKAQIREIGARCTNFMLDAKEKEFTIEMQGVRASILRAQNGQLNLSLDLDQKYGYDERAQELQLKRAQTITTYTNAVCRGVEAGSSALKAVGSFVNPMQINYNAPYTYNRY